MTGSHGKALNHLQYFSARGKGNIISYFCFTSSMTKILFDSEHYSISITIWHSFMGLILNFDSWLAGVRKLHVQKLRNVIITSVCTILFLPFDVMSTQHLKLYDSSCNTCRYQVLRNYDILQTDCLYNEWNFFPNIPAKFTAKVLRCAMKKTEKTELGLKQLNFILET